MKPVTDMNVEGHRGIEVRSVQYEIYYNDKDSRGNRFSPPDQCVKITQTYKGKEPTIITLEPLNVHSIYNFIQRNYTEEELK
tara:strand:+ start:178 stop:423 length:246 start_codon:yes stop_codon:yes gene_type:complete